MKLYVTVEEFLYAKKIENQTVRTLRGYKNTLNLFDRWIEKEYEIDELEKIRVVYLKQYIAYQLKMGHKATYVNNMIKILRAFLSIRTERIILILLITKVAEVKEEKPVIKTFSEQDDRQLLEYYSFANEEPRAKTKPQNLGPETTDWRQLYIFDFDDIVEAVEQRIEQLKEQVRLLRKQLDVLEKSVKSYVKSFRAANQELKTALGSCTWIYSEIKQMAQSI